MARVVNVLIIHGIGWGEQGKSYARSLEQNIRREFTRAARKLNLRDVDPVDAKGAYALRFDAVYWSPVTQKPQDALIELMGLKGMWPFRKVNFTYQMRRLMVGLLGDVISYESGGNNAIYREIHNRMLGSVENLSVESEGDRDDAGYAQLTIVGHSLGSVIASDFVWDQTRDATPKHCLPDHGLALKNMVLLGSPMGLYALRNNPSGTKRELAASLSNPIEIDPRGGMWVNMYDPADPIGFPLRPIKSYAEAGVIDCRVRAGSLFTTWNPASHVGYWRSRDVAQIIARKLALDWADLNSADFSERRYEKELKKFQRDLRRR